MKDWLNQLSLREKVMIGAAIALIVLIGGYQLVFKPVLAARQSALASYERQLSENLRVQEGVSKLQSIKPDEKTGPASSESLELLLSRTAAANGLEIVRLQPTDSNGVLVWFDKVDARLVMQWMIELETGNDMELTAFDLRRRTDEATLRGSVTFRRGGV